MEKDCFGVEGSDSVVLRCCGVIVCGWINFNNIESKQNVVGCVEVYPSFFVLLVLHCLMSYLLGWLVPIPVKKLVVEGGGNTMCVMHALCSDDCLPFTYVIVQP